jgi:hypothetical protein
MSEEHLFQAKLAIARNRWWAFRQRPEYQPTPYGTRYLLTSFGIGFTALFLMKCATRAEWLNLHAMYPIGAFLALIFVAFTLGTRREDNQRRKLRMQAFKDFAREYPWEFTYNLL